MEPLAKYNRMGSHCLARMHSIGCVPPACCPYLPACTARGQGGYLAPGGVPGPGGCTWSLGVYLVPGVYLVLGGVPGPRGGVYLVPGGVYQVPGGVYLVPGGCTWSRGCVPGPGGAPGPRRVPGPCGGHLPRYSPL